MSIRHQRTLLFAFSTLLLSGCGDFFAPPAAEFVYREETDELVSELSSGVKEQIEGAFGTPQDLVAWLKLPVDYGGVTGATQASELEGPINKFPVSFEEEALQSLLDRYQNDAGDFSIPEGRLKLDWLSGPLAGESATLINFSTQDQVAVILDPVESIPPEGSEFMLGAGENLKSGRKLYMEHCMHCHGVSGDGMGPTAPYLNPKPRDYRLGLFKFKSTLTADRISSDDLGRIIKYGIPGTYMPSFLLLEQEELHAIVEYVRWLSMRGELENRIVNELKIDYSKTAMEERAQDEEQAELDAEVAEQVAGLPELFDQLGDDLAEAWSNAETEDALIIPAIPRIPDSKESRELGRLFYLEKCTNCHGQNGLGNGSMTREYQKDEATGELLEEPGLHDVWGNSVHPRNLQLGQYRGGRRPVDLYRRIYGGITPSKMPNFATTDPETIWHAVNYVLHIPFEKEGEYTEVDREYEAKKKAAANTTANADSSPAPQGGGDEPAKADPKQG